MLQRSRELLVAAVPLLQSAKPVLINTCSVKEEVKTSPEDVSRLNSSLNEHMQSVEIEEHEYD